MVQCSARQSANRWWPLGVHRAPRVFAASVLRERFFFTISFRVSHPFQPRTPDGIRHRCNSHWCHMLTLPDAIIYPSGLSRSYGGTRRSHCLRIGSANCRRPLAKRHNIRCLQLHMLCTLQCHNRNNTRGLLTANASFNYWSCASSCNFTRRIFCSVYCNLTEKWKTCDRMLQFKWDFFFNAPLKLNMSFLGANADFLDSKLY